jgi:hypothetical protein
VFTDQIIRITEFWQKVSKIFKKMKNIVKWSKR